VPRSNLFSPILDFTGTCLLSFFSIFRFGKLSRITFFQACNFGAKDLLGAGFNSCLSYFPCDFVFVSGRDISRNSWLITFVNTISAWYRWLSFYDRLRSLDLQLLFGVLFKHFLFLLYFHQHGINFTINRLLSQFLLDLFYLFSLFFDNFRHCLS
jgi:hypothetical protein